MINNWLKNVLNILYPPTCALCGGSGFDQLDLCKGCYGDLPFNPSACTTCALPLTAFSTDSLVCGHCQQHAPSFQHCESLFVYASPIDKLIHQLKFQRQLEIGRLLGHLMAANLAQHFIGRDNDRPQYIIPVPLHRTRLRQRGYNQALELATPIAKRLNIPVLQNFCQRSKATLAQTELSAPARKKNVDNAFSVRPGLVASYVAIVDDVMTTGCTAEALARALLDSGVKRVDVWVCARAEWH